MTQPRRTIEQLLKRGILPIINADAAATHLAVYPSKRTWLAFFDKALLIIGIVALVLSLVFFVAFNWQHMGKMGRFALVEAGLVISIVLYVALSFRRRFRLIRQLLLLIASVITGSLLALFGQVYQTGANTWQLFFGWAVLITPWVVIARFPALWLLWLGLINTCLMLYLDVANLSLLDNLYQSIAQVAMLALINFIALLGWTAGDDKEFYNNIEELISKFSLDRINKSGAIFDTEKLNWLNEEHLRKKSLSELCNLLKEELKNSKYANKEYTDEYLIEVIKVMMERVSFIKEIYEKGFYFFEEPQQYDESVIKKRWKPDSAKILKKFSDKISDLNPTSKEDFETALKTTAEELNTSPGNVIHPLRLATTGVGGGPGIYDIVYIIGKEETIKRISAIIEKLK